MNLPKKFFEIAAQNAVDSTYFLSLKNKFSSGTNRQKR
jgi:hypothetical protein